MGQVLIQTLLLIAINVAFVAVLLCLIAWPLGRTRRAAGAIMRRDFLGYFANPTGYVFICLFTLLCSYFAFFPPEFFSTNLATLDQLNGYFPYIMLVFAPAVSMGIWAEERRQGTDELLLTLPAGDFDVVLGKFLAAAGVFTVSLIFSQLTNLAVLNMLTLGQLDTGLFVVTYLGYWLIGLAMISIGMVASFLTRNLTVSFILGALLNAPLVLLAGAPTFIADDDLARAATHWSLSSQFSDFGRGVASLSSASYYVMIVIVSLYVCRVMLGRRHWRGGRDGQSRLGHYLVRAASLIVIAVGLNLVLTRFDYVRIDATVAQTSSLSPDSRRMLARLDRDKPILIEAYAGKSLPQAFVRARFDLVSALKEIEAAAGGAVTVRLHDNLEPIDDEVLSAERRFGISPVNVGDSAGGGGDQSQVILGVAFNRGRQRAVIPLLGHRASIEYELMRGIASVSQEKRRTIAVLDTIYWRPEQSPDGRVFYLRTPLARGWLLDELRKQHEVILLEPDQVIDPNRYDALVAIQPSTMTDTGWDHLLEAIRSGLPTAVFEDPLAVTAYYRGSRGGWLLGTSLPRVHPAGAGVGVDRDMRADRLWKMLAIETSESTTRVPGDGAPNYETPNVIWQKYNAYPQAASKNSVLNLGPITDQWIFIRPESPGARQAFADNPITDDLNEVLLLYAGAVYQPERVKTLEYTELLKTGDQTGRMNDWEAAVTLRQFGPAALASRQEAMTHQQFAPAVRVRGVLPDLAQSAEQAARARKANAAEKTTDDAEQVEDGLYVSLGHGSHGLASAAMAGEHLAALLSGGAAKSTWCTWPTSTSWPIRSFATGCGRQARSTFVSKTSSSC